MNHLSGSLNSIALVIESNEINQSILIEDIALTGVNGIRDSNT